MTKVAPENVEMIKSPVFEWSAVIIKSKTVDEARLGYGSFATVYQAELAFNGNTYEVAVKVFDEDLKQGLNYDKLCEKADQEASIMIDIRSQIINVATIAMLYGIVKGPISPEISALFGLPHKQHKVGTGRHSDET